MDKKINAQFSANYKPTPLIEYAYVFVIAIVAFVLRWYIMGVETRMIPTDGVAFIEIAKNISSDFNFFHNVFTPGYSIWLAIVQGMTGVTWIQAGQWTSLIFALLLLLPLYSIFKYSVGTIAALIGLFFYACLPLWVELGSETQSMAVGSFWFFLALALGLKGIREGQYRIFILCCSGLSLGLAALCRPEFLVAAFILPLWLIYRGKYRGMNLIIPWLILIMCAVVYSPYVNMLHEHTGAWKISMKDDIAQKNAMAVGKKDYHLVREQNLQSQSGEYSTGILHFWFSKPLATVKRVGVNVYLISQYIWSAQFPVLLTGLLALGLLGVRSKSLDVLWIVTLTYLPTLTFILDARIMMPWATLFLAWVGLGVLFVLQKKTWLGMLALGLTVVFLIGSSLHSIRQADEDYALRQAGVWLKDQGGTEQVWSRKPWVAFYSAKQHLILPKDGELYTLVDAMGELDWLVVDSRHFAVARPKFYGKLFSNVNHKRLAHIKQFMSSDGHIVNIYQRVSE